MNQTLLNTHNICRIICALLNDDECLVRVLKHWFLMNGVLFYWATFIYYFLQPHKTFYGYRTLYNDSLVNCRVISLGREAIYC